MKNYTSLKTELIDKLRVLHIKKEQRRQIELLADNIYSAGLRDGLREGHENAKKRFCKED